MDNPQEPITRDDIRDKFAELTHNVQGSAANAKAPILGGSAALGVTLIVLAFWLGKRKGRAGRTVVEVRRV
ncbi:MAG: hypothetical protein OXE93_08890 [bacterium]|nr:hypothetical protein [bacterium]MCY4257432.1 hypothetical protein [bacterium]